VSEGAKVAACLICFQGVSKGGARVNEKTPVEPECCSQGLIDMWHEMFEPWRGKADMA